MQLWPDRSFKGSESKTMVARDSSSYRRTLWATSVVGGATLGALIIGLVRGKAVALIGGPSAVGLLGLFTSIVNMGASISTLGLDTSAVRQLSKESGDLREIARTRRAVWTIAWPLAVIGATLLWLFREPLARFAVGDATYGLAVGLLCFGIVASVIGNMQSAVLQAFGRVSDLARVKLWGALFGTAVGVVAIYRFGIWGIVVAVVALPAMNLLFSFWFGRKLPSSEWRQLFQAKLSDHWAALIAIGTVVMLTTFVGSLSQLSTRSMVTHQLGLAFAGFYHAGWSIISVNLSLVLNAMALDYYPRLAKVADEPSSIASIFNEQVHINLALAGPALVLLSVAAPAVLTVLYSGAFAEHALLLRLLIVWGLLRLPIWALGYILLVRKSGFAFLIGELSAASIIPLTWLLLPVAGLAGAGVAALLSGVISFFVYSWLVYRAQRVRMNSGNARMCAGLALLLTFLAILFEFSLIAGLIVGLVSALGLTWHSYRELRSALAGAAEPQESSSNWG
jgi:PST family polysaccharide transporter